MEDLVAGPACRSCGMRLEHVFADLGSSPLANSYLRAEDLAKAEPFYPLTVYVCGDCFLVQLPESASPESIFSDYAYFSSTSESWIRHAQAYVESISERLSLGPESQVVEIASNDGYLLQWFVERGVPVLGVEPAANVAADAVERGIPTRVAFFGSATANELLAEGLAADLLLGNNVLAHVPDLNDFVAGVATLLKPGGTATFEFPHLLQLIEHTEFDTIYHEHFSYFSLLAVAPVFERHGLGVVDVEELPTHGGSLRLYVGHEGRPGKRVEELLARERAAGLDGLERYARFEQQVRAVKRDLLELLIGARRDGAQIAGYGAAAKGNTLLNYCGIRADLLDYVVDRSPHKQGLFLPGTRLPIHPPERIAESRPDLVLILPWNLRDEIVRQMAHVRDWGGRFVVPVPTATVLE
ncbi:MAG TPA: class I SAM-dependent methyltransferase [Gaiellaceae bacterium]|nr:class I SAM-dependent methyltransferase [Gaiellaceae bacterium]